MVVYYTPAVGGIKRYRDTSVCPSVCLSQPRLKLAGCVAQLLGLSARWLPAAGQTPQMCGQPTRPRTDVDPPRVELPSTGGISSRRHRGDNMLVFVFLSLFCLRLHALDLLSCLFLSARKHPISCRIVVFGGHRGPNSQNIFRAVVSAF